MIKTYKNVKHFLPEDWYKISYKIVLQKIKNMTIYRQLSVKVVNNLFAHTHCRKRSAQLCQNVQFLLGSVKTQLDDIVNVLHLL